MTDHTPALRLEGIVKTFPGVRALDGVSFSVMPGEVHALMGENGAGKSTLMKVLGGIYQPDEGRIYIAERETVMKGPLEAKANGVMFIHQELSLAQELSVAENIYLGELPKRSFGRVDWGTLYDGPTRSSKSSRSGSTRVPGSASCRSPTSRWSRSPAR
jgi:ABC-type sugar transport system ATPase subunit